MPDRTVPFRRTGAGPIIKRPGTTEHTSTAGSETRMPASSPNTGVRQALDQPAAAQVPPQTTALITSTTTGFNPTVAHPARVYDYWLGGKDHFPADRKAAEEVIRLRPQVVASAQANRAFLARVVRYLAADYGIWQFLDVGTGLPAAESTHQVAQQVDPACRVCYVDNDPVVLTHARALLTSTPPGACEYIDADVRDTAAILAEAARTLDFNRPVAVLLLAILPFVPDTDDPTAIVAELAGGLAPGSYVAISHLTADFAAGQLATAVTAYNAQVPIPVTARTHAQVTGLFGGLPLVAPGVVPVTQWRPVVAGLPHRRTADLYAGVASIPRGRR
jgi:S-adenosyl methyltransferase